MKAKPCPVCKEQPMTVKMFKHWVTGCCGIHAANGQVGETAAESKKAWNKYVEDQKQKT